MFHIKICLLTIVITLSKAQVKYLFNQRNSCFDNVNEFINFFLSQEFIKNSNPKRLTD